MNINKPLCFITFIMFASLLPQAHAQSFSCSFGTPACLGYSDKVVSSNAICFDSYTCSGNFVCQSDLQNVAYKYDDLVDEYNELVEKANEAMEKARRNKSKYDDLSFCVMYASSLEDGRNCGNLY